MTRVLAAALVLCCSAAVDRALAASCLAELGRKEAQALVRQCTEISPATHPPCNLSNSCDLIRDEIRRGCEFAGADAPDFCDTDSDDGTED